MGQYWKLVNLDKREFVHPHKLGAGLKLWEQLANHPGTGAALIVLLAAMPELRGGGDLDVEANWHGPERTSPKYNTSPGPMPESYPDVARRTIGRWAGDRIALVGDYAERTDLAPEHKADLIYNLCQSDPERLAQVAHLRTLAKEAQKRGDECYGHSTKEWKELAKQLAEAQLYQDISNDVCAVIEHELRGEFVGEGWRDWKAMG